MRKSPLSDQAIKNCLNRIKECQSEDGSFPGVSIGKTSGKKSEERTTFSTSLILESLEGIARTSSVKEIAEKAAAYLLAQKSPALTWNYWHNRKKKNPNDPVCPDDLDDTFAALGALSIHKKEFFTPSTFPHIISILTKTEVCEGGPYNTWIVKDIRKKPWSDVDIVVNANVSYFLKLHGIDLPNLKIFFEKRIIEKDFSSKYYSSDLSVLYFISRIYDRNARKDAIKYILNKEKSDGSFGDMLQTSFALSALLNFGIDARKVEKAFDILHKSALKKDFVWLPFFMEENNEEPISAGSESMTAAFMLEAIVKYDMKAKENIAVRGKSRGNAIKVKILKMLRLEFSTFCNEEKILIEKYIKAVTESDNEDQVMLLPYHFRESLSEKFKGMISDEIIEELGLANLSGWLAYTLYDDILDDEADVSLIPIANVCLRKVTEIYSSLMPKENQGLFREIMNGIEKANLWERKHCKFPVREKTLLLTSIPNYGEYKILSDKSFGHALSPLCILFNLGLGEDREEIKNMKSFFKHYIIARQLNDDAHDFISDLSRGFLNSVSVEVIKIFLENNRSLLPYLLNLSGSKKELEKIFWHEKIEPACNDIFYHIAQARNSLNSLSIISDIAYFESMLLPIENSAKKALSEKERTIEFLEEYART